MPQPKIQITQKAFRNYTAVALIIAACLIWWVYYTKNFTGLLPTDTYRYAAIARNILTGDGFVESQIWPVRFVYDSEPPFHVNRIPPLQPFLIAASFKLFGTSEASSAIVSGIFYVLTAFLTFLILNHLFPHRSKWLILTVLVLLLFDPTLLRYSISGLTELTFCFFLLFSLYAILKGISKYHLLFAGVLYGFAYLTRPEALIYTLPISVFLFFFHNKNWQFSAYFLLSFVLSLLPYLIWRYITFGNPFFELNTYLLLRHTITFPGEIAVSSLNDISPISYILTHPAVIFKKFLDGLLNAYFRVLYTTNPYVMVLFIAGSYRIITYKMSISEIRVKLLFLLYALFLISILFSSFTSYKENIRFLVPFIPLIIIYSTEPALYSINKAFPNRNLNTFIIMAFVFFIISPTLYSHFHHGKVEDYRESAKLFEYRKLGNWIRHTTEKDDFVITNLPQEIAWYSDRHCIGLPVSSEVIQTIDKDIVNISAVLLSSIRRLDLSVPFNSKWNDVLYQSRNIPRYRLLFQNKHSDIVSLLFQRLPKDAS